MSTSDVAAGFLPCLVAGACLGLAQGGLAVVLSFACPLGDMGGSKDLQVVGKQTQKQSVEQAQKWSKHESRADTTAT